MKVFFLLVFVTIPGIVGHDPPEYPVGRLACRLVPEPHNQLAYDLFIGEVIGAWADDRVFSDGHWRFDDAPDDLRTIHHVPGVTFLVPGEVVQG